MPITFNSVGGFLAGTISASGNNLFIQTSGSAGIVHLDGDQVLIQSQSSGTKITASLRIENENLVIKREFQSKGLFNKLLHAIMNEAEKLKIDGLIGFPNPFSTTLIIPSAQSSEKIKSRIAEPSPHTFKGFSPRTILFIREGITIAFSGSKLS